MRDPVFEFMPFVSTRHGDPRALGGALLAGIGGISTLLVGVAEWYYFRGQLWPVPLVMIGLGLVTMSSGWLGYEDPAGHRTWGLVIVLAFVPGLFFASLGLWWLGPYGVFLLLPGMFCGLVGGALFLGGTRSSKVHALAPSWIEPPYP